MIEMEVSISLFLVLKKPCFKWLQMVSSHPTISLSKLLLLPKPCPDLSWCEEVGAPDMFFLSLFW